ncbi:MAG: hypothetical protein FWE67_08245 [Planctomycetaceae bacterium]|nr:hypothetical protein [Planctomycetaceae bacterium]
MEYSYFRNLTITALSQLTTRYSSWHFLLLPSLAGVIPCPPVVLRRLTSAAINFPAIVFHEKEITLNALGITFLFFVPYLYVVVLFTV